MALVHGNANQVTHPGLVQVKFFTGESKDEIESVVNASLKKLYGKFVIKDIKFSYTPGIGISDDDMWSVMVIYEEK